MRLFDVISHMELAVWAELGLVLFIAVFMLILFRVIRSPRAEMDRLAALPLAGDAWRPAAMDTTPDPPAAGSVTSRSEPARKEPGNRPLSSKEN